MVLPKPKRPIGELEAAAYGRAKRDHARWTAKSAARCPADGYWFDEDAAERACRFFPEMLRHHKGEWAGKPFVLADWQEFSIREVFGWKRPDGTRRFRSGYNEVPRKNGKTEKAAGIGLLLTVADREDGAEVYSAATKKDQAKIAHDAATKMVKRSPGLQRFLGLRRNNIHCERLGSKFEPLGADADTLDGLNAHGVVVDELHAHRDRRVVDVLETSMGSRRQPLMWYITTAGIYDPESIGWQVHEYAVNVLEGIFEDETFFAFIACADKEDDWRSPETWQKANPNYGISVKPEFLAEQCKKAENQPTFENSFKRYYLNIWTEQKTRWLPMDRWNECPARPAEDDLVGLSCYGGLDLSTTQDITAFLLAFQRDDGFVDMLARFWLPESRIAEAARGRIRAPYDVWAKQGLITPTPGEVIDYDFIRAHINADGERFGIQEIAYDPWNAEHIRTKLEDDGFVMAQTRQGYKSLSEPSKHMERLVVSRKLRHGRNAVLTWMAANVSVRTDPNGNIAPEKPEHGAASKVDGILAGVMALSRMIVHREEAESVYNGRGLLTV